MVVFMLKSIYEIRREWLIHLAKEFKTQKEFAARIGITSPRMSQLLKGTDNYVIGDDIARRIEEEFGLMKYQLDHEMKKDEKLAITLLSDLLSKAKAGGIFTDSLQ